jgi:hypothetical protein
MGSRSWLFGIIAAACGNPDTEPVVLRAETAAPTSATPTTPPPSPATSATTAGPASAEPIVQAPLPPPPSPDEDPVLVPLAADEIALDPDLEHGVEPIAEGFHMEAVFPVLADEAKTSALASRLRADVRRVLASDPNAMPRDYEGSCDLTIVTETLVSYMCHYSVTEYGDRETWTNAGLVGLTYDVERRWPAPSPVRSWFVPGTDAGTIADVACRKVAGHRDVFGSADGCVADDVEFAIQENGIRVGWPSTSYDASAPERSELVLGWNEIGKLVRRDGPLATLANAVANADAETPLSRAAGPPPAGSTVLAIGNEGSLREIARRWSLESGVRVMVTDAAAGRARLVRARGVATSSVDGAAVSRANVPFVLPELGIATRRIRRGTTLRSEPRAEASAVAPLVAGAIVATLSGPVGTNESSLTPGMWTYVVPNASTGGWIQSGLLGSRRSTPFDLARSAEADRGPRTFTVALSDPSAKVLVHYAASADGTRTEIKAVGPGGPRTFGPVEGSIADLRLTRAARGGELFLLVALSRSGAPDSVQWQAYRLGSGQPTSAVLDVALPTDASLPEARRTAVRAGIQNHGRFAPFLVQKRGTADVVYTWNGSTLSTGGP